MNRRPPMLLTRTPERPTRLEDVFGNCMACAPGPPPFDIACLRIAAVWNSFPGEARKLCTRVKRTLLQPTAGRALSPQLSLENSNLVDTPRAQQHEPPRTWAPDHQTHHSCRARVLSFVVGGGISILLACPLLPCLGLQSHLPGRQSPKKTRAMLGARFSGIPEPVRCCRGGRPWR